MAHGLIIVLLALLKYCGGACPTAFIFGVFSQF